MNPVVWVILVNYRGASDTIECVDSLNRYAHFAKILIVENGSGDGSAGLIRSAHPRVHIVESPANLGFTGGNNLAIREALAADAEYIWLLNNDTIVEPGALAELLSVSRQDSSIGILSPRIDYYDAPGAPWFVGSRLDLEQGEAVHDNAHVPTNVIDVPWITGCAMFCRAEMLRQTGGFDDRYFLNWEDVDLSLRAIKLGWRLKLAPDAVIRHKIGRSQSKVSRQATYYWTRNRLLLTSTYGSELASQFVRRNNYWRALRSLWRLEDGAWGRLLATRQASYDARRGRFGALAG